MVKFAKNGSDVTTAAVKLARAYTGRDLVAICGDHPFFSVDDWFIGTTELNAGIPEAISRMTLKFRYNDLDSLRQLFDQYPESDCLRRSGTGNGGTAGAWISRSGETTLRRARRGSDVRRDHHRLSLASVRSAEIPRRCSASLHLRQRHGQRISRSRRWSENEKSCGSAAWTTISRAFFCFPRLTVQKAMPSRLRSKPFVSIANATLWKCLWKQGERLRTLVNRSIEENHLAGLFRSSGPSLQSVFVTRDQDGQRSQPFRTLFMQELIRRGVIGPSFVVSFSHSDADIDRTGEAVHESPEGLSQGARRRRRKVSRRTSGKAGLP